MSWTIGTNVSDGTVVASKSAIEQYLNMDNLTTQTNSGTVEKSEVVNNVVIAPKSVIDTYGIRQEIIVQNSKQDPKVTALRKLNDNCIPKETIEVECFGDTTYKVGYGVHVILPFLPKYEDCFMYIKEISNEWKDNGIFTSTLTLTPSRVMDEQEWSDDDDYSGNNASTGGSATAKKIIALLTQQIGKPYVWGATGPDTFDCSGLTQYCYNQFSNELINGKPIDRTSQQQMTDGEEVDKSDHDSWQPADLLFFESGGHVTAYIGNGSMIEAPHTGLNVRKTDDAFTRSGLCAVRRVVPKDTSSDDSNVDLSNATEINMDLSFYTGAEDEGGSTSASGKELTYGMCASNVYPIGTKFYIKGINGLSDGVFTVEDKGGSDFNSSTRLDIYVGNGHAALVKAENLGRQTCKAYKLNS
jgi:cell wall-associated NlpC family hydrolase